MRTLVTLATLLSLLSLGSSCGTSVSFGNSYAYDSTAAIQAQTGCPTLEYAAPGRTIAGFGTTSMLQGPDDLLPQWQVDELAAASGPVTVYLQAGHGDELNEFWGPLEREVVAANDANLVMQLLAIRPDLYVVQIEGVIGSTCDHTYQLLLPYLGPRYQFIELPQLDATFTYFFDEHMRDDCHPNDLGVKKRIAQTIQNSTLAQAGVCY